MDSVDKAGALRQCLVNDHTRVPGMVTGSGTNTEWAEVAGIVTLVKDGVRVFDLKARLMYWLFWIFSSYGHQTDVIKQELITVIIILDQLITPRSNFDAFKESAFLCEFRTFFQ